MQEREFLHFLRKWRAAKRYPPRSAWPQNLSLADDAWKGITKMYQFTNDDQHEYETSLFHVGAETYLSKPLRGSTHAVTAKHSLELKYDVDQKRGIYIQHVLLDGNAVGRNVVKPEKLAEAQDAGFLFNIHTHPVHVNAAGQITYSFFSSTDIRTLLAGDTIVSGLITDCFWLVAKTDAVIGKIGEVGEELLYGVSEKAFGGEQYLEQIIRENMFRWGLVFYRGEFGKSLVRVN